MNNRQYIEVENLVDFIVDNRGKSVPTVEEGIPLIATNCIKNESVYPTYENIRYVSKKIYDTWFRSHLKPYDILFVNKGTPGRACIVPDPVEFVAAQDMVGLRFKENYNPYYMLAVIRSKEIQKTIENNHVGLVIPHFRKQELVKLKLPILNNVLRNIIGKIYKSISDKIEINNKINQELEALAKTIYDYWFVQFDFPYVTSSGVEKPYKSSGGKMVYNDELKREIPEGWEASTVADWIEKDKNGDWGKDHEEGNYTHEVSCIRGADINGLNGYGEVKAPTRFILEKNKNKILEVGDLIIEISGGSPTQSTGRLAFITEETLDRFENPLICSNFCKAVTLKDETYLYNFVYKWNRIYDAGILFGWEGKTSGIKNLLFENFIKNFKVVKPTKGIVELFNDKVKVLHQKKQKNLLENEKLSTLRDWLLPMLMNGQVRVSEIGDELSMAAEQSETYGSLNFDDSSLLDLYAQLACISLIEEKKAGYVHAKTGFQKTMYLAKTAKQQQCLAYISEVRHYHGTYSKQIAKAVETNPFFYQETLNDGGIVYKVMHNKTKELLDWMQEEKNKPFVNAIEELVDLYQDPIILNDIDRMELLNTVFKIMLDTGSTDFDVIWEEMKTWPINKEHTKFKSDKFDENITKAMIGFIKRLSWA